MPTPNDAPASLVRPGTRWLSCGHLPRRVLVVDVADGCARVQDEGTLETWLEPINTVERWSRRHEGLERMRNEAAPALQVASRA